MQLKTVFGVFATLSILTSLGFLLAPEPVATSLGVNLETPSAVLLTRNFGVYQFGLGVMAWLGRETGPSKARDVLVKGLILINTLTFVSSIIGILNKATVSGWAGLIISVLLALGFWIASRAEES